jgi:hypothetical protein
MSLYADYLDRQMTFEQLVAERKKQLKRISDLRGRPVLVYASDLEKQCPNGIDYSDVLPFSDQLSVLGGTEIDIILETPGGFSEVVEDLVRLVRDKYQKVGIIVPGYAKSAGTIFAMAADEILMGKLSALGPIDAQIRNGSKGFSADAFLAWLKEISVRSQENKHLDLIYIPMLQGISPGEIQHCENAQSLSRDLVTKWLKEYKFKYWDTHTSSGLPVTAEEKEKRAKEIASLLCNNKHWLTHSRSIKISDFVEMKLLINDFSQNPDLNDAIMRYYTLLRMSFETNIYKIYETPTTQIYRMLANEGGEPKPNAPFPADQIIINVNCRKCGRISQVQADFKQGNASVPGTIRFPANNLFRCPNCGSETNLLTLRQNLEAQSRKPIL